MNKNNKILIQMLIDLEASGIEFTSEFYKDISSLVDTNVQNFVKVFSKDIQILNLDEYTRFEKLNLTQNERLKLNRK